MQVKQSLCKIELYDDPGTEYPKDVLYLQPVQTYKAQTQCWHGSVVSHIQAHLNLYFFRKRPVEVLLLYLTDSFLSKFKH